MPVHALGDNKVIASIGYNPTTGELSVVVHLPTKREGEKTYYQPVMVSTGITTDDRDAIIKVFGGVKCNN